MRVAWNDFGTLGDDTCAQIVERIVKTGEGLFVVDSNFMQEINHVSGVYFLLDDSGVDYVGQSQSIGKRLKNHHVFCKDTHRAIAVYKIDNAIDRCVLEREIIKCLCPPKNDQYVTFWDIYSMEDGIIMDWSNVPVHKRELPDNDPVSSYGVGLRVSEWQRVEQIAEEMGITKHAVAAYGLRYFLKQYDAGEIQTVSKPTLPDIGQDDGICHK